MYKKNYISRGEAEIWELIKEKEIVEYEAVRDIFPEMPAKKLRNIMHSLFRKGYLMRARKGLYYNPLIIKDYHALALKLKQGYIGLGSALRHYNLIEYEDFTIFIITRSFRKKIALKGTKYELNYMPFGRYFAGFEKREGLYVSSLEKTFFDCFLKPRFVSFSTITKSLYDAKIDWSKFISFFRIFGNNSLCQRTGYILEMMKKNTNFKVPSFVLKSLADKVKNPVKLMPVKGRSVYNRKWKVQDNLGKENILAWWY